MTQFNKIFFAANVAVIAALVLVITVYAWNGPGAAPPTGGGALSVAADAPKSSLVINADGTMNATSTVTVGGGSGKINVGTVDPIYTIGGARYATYMAGMTGVKEETTGVVQLRNFRLGEPPYEYIIDSYVIDFSKAKKGSDAWLFWQTTDFGRDWGRLSVLLTPNFDGRVWYEKKPAEKKLVIYAALGSPLTLPSPSLEVSYRLTAPRFDHAEWPNTVLADYQGFLIPEK